MAVEVVFDGSARGALAAARQTREAIKGTAEEAEAAAAVQVKAEVEKQDQLRKLIVLYKETADQATKGSREQVVAAGLARDAQKELAHSVGATHTSNVTYTKGLTGVEQGLARTTRGALAGSGAFNALGRAVAFSSVAFLGAAGFVHVVDIAVNKAEALDAELERSRTIFGSHAKAVEAWSLTSAKAMGLSRVEALKFAGDVGTMLKGIGLVPAASAAMSKSVVQLAADLGALHRVDPAQVLSAFEAALAGRTRGLKEYGIFIDAAAIKAEAMREGIVKTTVDSGKLADAQTRVSIAQAKVSFETQKYGSNSTQAASARVALDTAERALTKTVGGSAVALTGAQKAQVIYAIATRQAADAHGYFAAHADRADLAEKRLHASIGDMEASIGKALLPTVEKVVSRMADWIGKSENQKLITHDVTKAVHALTGAAEDLWPVVKTVAHWAQVASDAVGGFKHVVELLIALKVLTWVNGLTGGLSKLIGSAGAGGLVGAEGAATGLMTKLKLLMGLGAITIPILLLINAKAVDQTVGNWLDQHGLGFLGGTQESQQSVADILTNAALQKKIRDTFGQKVLNQMIAAAKQQQAATAAAGAPAGPPSGGGATAGATPLQSALVATAKSQIGVPYSWGGGSTHGPTLGILQGANIVGFDCSAFVQYVMAQNGITVPRTSQAQYAGGTPVAKGDWQPGDLVFFDGSHPGHVGIYIGNDTFIESPHTGDVIGYRKLSTYPGYVGARRYVPSGARSTGAPAGPPKPRAEAGQPPPTSTPPLTVGTRPSTKPPQLIPGYTGMETLILTDQSKVASSTNRDARYVALRKEITDDLSLQALLEEAAKTAKGERAKKIAAALKAVADDLKAARGKLADDAKAAAKDAKTSAEHRDTVAVLADLLGTSVASDAGRGLDPQIAKLQAMSEAARKKLIAALKSEGKKTAAEIANDKTVAQAIGKALGQLPDDLIVQTRDTFGNITGTATVGQEKTLLDHLFDKLATGGLSAGQRAKIAAQIKTALASLTSFTTSAVDQANRQMQERLSTISDLAMAAANRETTDHLKAMSKTFQAATNQIDRELTAQIKLIDASLSAQLNGIDAALKQRLAGIEATRKNLTPAEKALAAFQAAHDAAAAERQLTDAQKALADAQAGGDPLAIQQAQQALDDLLYQRKVADMQRTADAERQTADQIAADATQAAQDAADAEKTAAQAAHDLQVDLANSVADAKKQAAQDVYDDAVQKYQDERDAYTKNLGDMFDAYSKYLAGQGDEYREKALALIAWINANPIPGYSLPLLPGLTAPGGPTQPGDVQAAGIGTGVGDPNGTDIGSLLGFARGGRVPGRYVGQEDTILARVTPGENVTDRRLSDRLDQVADIILGGGGGGGGPTTVILEVDGNQFAKVVAAPVSGQINRLIGYPSPMGP